MVDGCLIFLLGGHDLEMLTIRELLQSHGANRVVDRGLAWGVRASDYREEITSSLAAGLTPVLVEIEDDMELGGRVVIVDHHGPLAGADRPTSLHQIFALLGLPHSDWTRWLDLVAANDRGYIPALCAIHATREEIEQIRRADRAAQGITEAEEQQAVEALQSLVELGEGKLSIVRLAHNKTAPVVDRLAPELGGKGCGNLLIISPGEVNYYGDGAVIQQLQQQFPGGWYGGALPDRGFWGIATNASDNIVHWLQGHLHG